MDWLPFFVARRVWCVFRFAFTHKRCDQLHPQPGESSSTKIVPGGIFRISGTSQCFVRQALCFQTAGIIAHPHVPLRWSLAAPETIDYQHCAPNGARFASNEYSTRG